MKEYTLDNYLNDKLKNEEFKEVYDESQADFEIMKAICDARISKSITQKELSLKTGISQADLSRIETGNANPSLKTLKRIAKALNCTLMISFVQKD